MKNNSNKKKIAMFSIHSDPLASLGSQESGGQNIYIRCLIEELEKLGWQTDVFTRWDSPYKKRIVRISKNSRVIRLKGGPVKYFPKKELFSILPNLYKEFINFIGVKNPYVLFHGHYWDGGWMALKAHEKFNKPLIQNFHSIGKIRQEIRKKYKKNSEEEEYSQKRIEIEKSISSNASFIISLSQTEKDDLVNMYNCDPKKINVIPGGINLKHWKKITKEKARSTLRINPEDYIILYVGRLEWRKGIGTLIVSARQIRKEIPNLKLIIVGGKIFGKNKNEFDFTEYQNFQKKAKIEGVSDIVKFVGNIDNGRLSFYYQSADILIIPSYYEPFGLVALEGMVNKVPVVASRIGGLSTIFTDKKNGLLFEPRNPIDLKNKVLDLYQSESLVQEITNNAYKEIINNYSWHRIVKKISEKYKLIIEDENNSNSSI